MPVSVSVLTSTLKRTIQTARYLPFPKLRWKALDEIDAGERRTGLSAVCQLAAVRRLVSWGFAAAAWRAAAAARQQRSALTCAALLSRCPAD